MDPLTIALIQAGVSAAGSAAGGLLGRTKEPKMSRQKRELIDDLLASVKGDGIFSDMFNTSEDAFNKAYVEPAKARFRNQIAPQIQQSYIASGQQRGSGLEDTLARAGVDLDQLLNEQYLDYQNRALDRQQQAINQVLGFSAGNPTMSRGSALKGGLTGYLTSDSFGKDIGAILNANRGNPAEKKRTGYESESGIGEG